VSFYCSRVVLTAWQKILLPKQGVIRSGQEATVLGPRAS
jgi:hypothetical protein